MAKTSTQNKENDFSPEVMSKIIWGVFEKFRNRHPEEIRAGHGDKGSSNMLIMADIYLYLHENYSVSNESNQHIDNDIISEISENLKSVYNEFLNNTLEHSIMTDVKKILNQHESEINLEKKNQNKRWFKVVEKRRFEDFISASNLLRIYQCVESNIHSEIPRIQLEALCLYGWDTTYKQVCISSHFYKHKGKIRFIPIDLRGVFEPSLRTVLTAFNNADKKGGSEKMLNRAGEIFINETERLCADFSNGKIPTRSYLKDLMYSMEICDSGFGISIPEFSKYWETTEGKNILEMNFKQAEKLLVDENGDKRKTDAWIRIFFVNGEKTNSKKLTKAENKMLKAQLEKKVHVVVVLKDAWKHLSKEDRERCDFAVFRIENCPSLMSTQFEKGEAEGIFYTDESMPEQHYKEHLEKILSKDNSKHIYEPELKNNKLVLGSPVRDTHLEGITGKLERIYKKSK